MPLLWEEITWPDPRRLAAWVMASPRRFWFDRAMPLFGLPSYSLLFSDPVAVLTWRGPRQGTLNTSHAHFQINDPQGFLEDWVSTYQKALPVGGDLCGGVVGVLPYEALQWGHPFSPRRRDPRLDGAQFFLFDTGLLLEPEERRARVFSWGVGADLKLSDVILARDKVDHFIAQYETLALASADAGRCDSWVQETPREVYVEKVRRIQEALRDGECYQVNFSQKFSLEGNWEPERLYLKLREVSPSVQMVFANFEDWQILSASPETLLYAHQNRVFSYPIKGTRPRGSSVEEDQKFIEDLQNNPKDFSELLMIVDLLRNDLGKSCNEISVEAFPELLTLPQVHHHWAKISAHRPQEVSLWRILWDLFPGGSITGAPKLKAMEWIDRLEDHARGIYTGSLGYVTFGGEAHFNIAIRTALLKRGRRLEYFSGGGVVVDSDPEAEYEESLHKATGFFQTLGLTEILKKI